MLKSEQVAALVLAALVAAVACFGIVQMSRSKRHRPKQQWVENTSSERQKINHNDKPASDHENPSNKADNARPTFSAPTINHSSDENRHKAGERIFWQNQIRVGNRLNYITAFAAFVAIVGLFFIYLSISHADRATVAANRAWLASSWGKDSFISPNIIYEVKFTNVGKAPATDAAFSHPIQTYPQIKSTYMEAAGIDWPNDDTCRYVTPRDNGLVVFPIPDPGITQFYTVMTGVGNSQFLKDVMDGKRGIFILGCVAYKTFSETHHTQYCFLLKKMPNNEISATNCTSGAYAD